MARAQRPEMSLIKRRELRFVKSLDDCEHSRVYEPNVGIVVAIAKRAGTRVIDRLQILNLVGPRLDVVEKGNQHPWVQPLVDPIVDLNEHRGRDNQRFVRRLDEPPARRIVVVAAIE